MTLIKSVYVCFKYKVSVKLRMHFLKMAGLILDFEYVWYHASYYRLEPWVACTAQKMKFSIKDFFSRNLKKSLMENLIFCTVLFFGLLSPGWTNCHKITFKMSQNLQKQPPEVFYWNRCSQKFCKIRWKTPVSESLFNKVAGLRLRWKFIFITTIIYNNLIYFFLSLFTPTVNHWHWLVNNW